MRYFKIILDGSVIGAGCNFMRYYPRTQGFAYCDMEVAECAKDVVSELKYHDGWLKRSPVEAGTVPEARVVLIEQAEYDDLIEQLMDGETVPEPVEPEPEPTPEPEPEPEPERRMTVQEMREKITEQASTIEMLTECLLEMSEIVYGGDL